MAFLVVMSSPFTAFSCWYFLEDVSYLWEEGGGFTKNILSYLENVIFDLGREGLKANFGNVMIYAGIFHGNRPLYLSSICLQHSSKMEAQSLASYEIKGLLKFSHNFWE